MPYQYRKDMDHSILFDIPLSELEISHEAIEVLNERGMTKVEHCMQFFISGSRSMIRAPHVLFKVMKNEVMPSLIEQGYWEYLEWID